MPCRECGRVAATQAEYERSLCNECRYAVVVAELEQTRKTNKRLNRRCQVGESALAERVKQTPVGGMGRHLLRWYAGQLCDELAQARKERDVFERAAVQAQDERNRVRAAVKFYRDCRDETCVELQARCEATDHYPALVEGLWLRIGRLTERVEALDAAGAAAMWMRDKMSGVVREIRAELLERCEAMDDTFALAGEVVRANALHRAVAVLDGADGEG